MTTRSVHGFDVFGQAERTASDWLGTVARFLGTDDPHRAHRILRAWLHTVRDRLGVETAAHVAAQLPLIWRGLFYDGWLPAQVPVKYDVDQFLMTMAQNSGLSLAEARQATAAVTAALTELTSEDLIGHVQAALPAPLRELLRPEEGRHHQPAGAEPSATPHPRAPAATEQATKSSLDDRVDRLDRDVQTIAEALNALVDALDVPPSREEEPAQHAAAIRRAHQLLLTRSIPD